VNLRKYASDDWSVIASSALIVGASFAKDHPALGFSVLAIAIGAALMTQVLHTKHSK